MIDPLQRRLEQLSTAHVQDPSPDWASRADRLRRLEALLVEDAAAIRAAINADFGGRPSQETDLLELYPSLSEIRHALRYGRRWMRPQRRLAPFPFLPARIARVPQPLGVIGIIVPWNYPLNLAIGPLTGALVAGNRAMLKMSELTPRFGALFAERIHHLFGPDEVQVVNGDADIARAFATLPFDHLLFTGSSAVGTQVMHAAAEHLTPVTLELGGKSPALIGPNADLAHAVRRILAGKLVNAGQTCVAPDYVLLPRAQVSGFIEQAQAATAQMYPDLAGNDQYTAIIGEGHCRRLLALRDDAVAAGARALPLGVDAAIAAAPFNGLRLAPTLLLEVTADMAVMREEIFGPWLPVLPYDDLEQALAYITARPHPLALYLFERDRRTLRQMLAATRAGGVSVNDTLYHAAQPDLPFGGVGASGMGGYHGEYGFRTFSHDKPIFFQTRFTGTTLLGPPYGRLFQRVMAMLLRAPKSTR